MSEETYSNLVQLPAMKYPNGTVQMFPTQVMERSALPQLKEFAEVMDAQLVFIKMRAIYTQVETPLCLVDDCWNRDEHDGYCFKHKGK